MRKGQGRLARESMRIVRSVPVMQSLAGQWKRAGVRVALVPTMGFLHEGHLSLIRRARRLAGARGKVVASIYVNPTQFGPREDFSKYPRDFARDARLCRKEQVDVIFAPDTAQMYPGGEGAFSTFVSEETLSRGMEGASRPGHFRGVTTVVAKLFNIVQPAFAVFGAKDFQQAAIVERMVRDLNFPLKLVVAPTTREADGLALSSRNKYLDSNLRRQAVVLWLAIERARAAISKSKSRPLRAAAMKRELKKFIERQPDARVDYIEFFDPRTLSP
ncbi:MAG TPA: pantoate--beta-alanine ligase, partial [Verrucomicrobiae bacterium]|nr:pantoate--beta-alanine ligase [Verrucomicrobiae bacterium]